MAATTTTQAPRPSFQSPPHIIIPKLVQSRDTWKSKATQRKHELKKAQIRTRDLTASRLLWKQRALAAEQKAQLLQEQLEQAQAQLQQAQAEITRLQEDQKKTRSSHP